MSWWTFAGTFLAGAIVIGGFIWQKTRDKVGTIADVRAHLGRAYKGPSDSWTPAWIDGQDKPLKIEAIGPIDVAYLEDLYNDGLGKRTDMRGMGLRIVDGIDTRRGSETFTEKERRTRN